MDVAKSKIYQVVGEAIHIQRRRSRMSQEKLAEKAGLNRNYIGEIERAEKNITLETLEKIAKVLEVHVRDLFNGL
jgi:transcriptional regulator with XRE-family HTH domain